MRYSRMLEESSFANKKADYLWLLLTSSVMLLVRSLLQATCLTSSVFRPYPHLLTSHSSLLLSLSFPYTYGQDVTQRLQFRFLGFSRSVPLIYQLLWLLSPGYSMALGRLLWPILLDVGWVISAGFYGMCGYGSFWGEQLFSLSPLRSCKYECGLNHCHVVNLVTHQENLVR